MGETVVRSLDERTAKVAEKIASHIEARLGGGPNLKPDDLALIDGLRDELSAEEIAGWKQQVGERWDRVNGPPRERRRGFGPKLKLVEPAKEEGPPAEIEAAPSVFEEHKSEGGEDWEPIVWKLSTFADAPQLSRKAPLDNAKLFTKRKLEFSADGKASGPGTYFYQGKWWQWNEAFYEKAPDQRIIDMACEFMDGAVINTGEGMARFKPTTTSVSTIG